MNTKFYDYNQEAMAKYNVSIQEAFLLNYLRQFFKTGRAEELVSNGETFYKIYYSKILSDNVALQIGKEGLRKMLRSLEERGWITRHKENINSSTLYMRVNDRALTYTHDHTIIPGKDRFIANFVDAAWNIKKNAKSKFELYEDVLGNRHCKYSHTLIDTRVIIPWGEIFTKKLFSNLKMTLSPAVYNSLDQNKVIVIHNEIDLSTINNGTLGDIFKDNLNKIESAICLTFVEILKL